MAALMPQGKQQYFTAGGIPLVGGKVYTYAAGTTTPLATYTTAAASTPNTNPVILDSRGEASIFFSAANYKIVVKDSLDSTIWTQDNLPGDQAATILANLAASTGSSLIGYLPAGTGAVATTVQGKLRESVSVLDFIPVELHAAIKAGIDTTDLSIYLQAAFTASPEVTIPHGIFHFSTTINLTLPNMVLRGVNKIDSLLVYTGAAKAFNCVGNPSGAYYQLHDFRLQGTPVAPRYFTASTYAFFGDINCNFEGHNLRIEQFDIMFTGYGGYYWKFFNCQFYKMNYGFKGVSPNNLAFFGCRFGLANTFVSVSAGAGPVSFIGGSLEGFVDACISETDGGITNVNIIGTYFENDYSVDNTGTGLTGNFTQGIAVNGEFYAVSFIGNNVQCKGIRRLVSLSSGVQSALVAHSNWLQVETGSDSTTEYLYYSIKADSSADIQDSYTAVASLGIGSYTTGVAIACDNVTGTNPVNGQPLTSKWYNITPINGWTNSGGIGYPLFGCKVQNGILYFRGQIDGTSASSGVVGILPAAVSARIPNSATEYSIGIAVEAATNTVRYFRLLKSDRSILFSGPYTTVLMMLTNGMSVNT